MVLAAGMEARDGAGHPRRAAGLQNAGVCAASLPPFKAARALCLLVAQQPRS